MVSITLLACACSYVRLHGDISRHSIENAKQDLNTSNNWLHIDTNGGDARAGVEFMQFLLHRNDVRCVVDSRAHSMGFAILQACRVRYVRPDAILYQHELQVSVSGSLSNVRRFVSFADAIQTWVVSVQAARIGISPRELLDRVTDGWLLNSSMAILHNCADYLWLKLI